MEGFGKVYEQGRRGSMEDACELKFLNDGMIFGGVYDGHNGERAAVIAAACIFPAFSELVAQGISTPDAFSKVYSDFCTRLETQSSGTCAANFFIKDSQVFYANAGDCRIIIVTKNGVKQLTVDHRTSNLDERNRINGMGGNMLGKWVVVSDGFIMVTRSLENPSMAKFGVISEPDTGTHDIEIDDLYLIAGCDGLFDYITNEQIADMARKFTDHESLANALKEEILDVRQGTDNLTILILPLN